MSTPTKKPSLAIVTRNYIQKTAAKFAARFTEKEKVEEREGLTLKNAMVIQTYQNPELKVESSFGCGVVIQGTPCTKKKIPSTAIEVKFDGGYAFRRVDNHDRVPDFKEIYFTPTGIFAVLP